MKTREPVVLRDFVDCPPVAYDRDRRAHGSYLVDPASSHMLVLKIKPCMSKYELV